MFVGCHTMMRCDALPAGNDPIAAQTGMDSETMLIWSHKISGCYAALESQCSPSSQQVPRFRALKDACQVSRMNTEPSDLSHRDPHAHAKPFLYLAFCELSREIAKLATWYQR